MKLTIKKIKQYSKPCSICNKLIKGYSENQVNYNIKLHEESHKNEKQKDRQSQ